MLLERNGACGVKIRKYLPGIDFKAPDERGDPPQAFTETINEELVPFVLQIPSRMDELQARLSTVHSTVVVDTCTYEKDQVKIKPMKGAERQLEWKAQAQKGLREFREQFEKKVLHVDENVDPNVFEPDGSLKTELEELKKSVLVVPDKRKKCFEVYGAEGDVLYAHHTLETSIAVKQLMKTNEDMKVRLSKLALLEKMGTLEDIKSRYAVEVSTKELVESSLDVGQHAQIFINGLRVPVSKAFADISGAIGKIAEDKITTEHPSLYTAVVSQTGLKFIKSELDARELRAVAELVEVARNTNEIHIFASGRQELTAALVAVKKAIENHDSIDLSPDQAEMVDKDRWNKEVLSEVKKDGYIVDLKCTAARQGRKAMVELHGTETAVREVKSMVEAFLNNHAHTSSDIPLTRGQAIHMEAQCKDVLRQCVNDLRETGVRDIKIVDLGLRIMGTKEGINAAKERCKVITDSIAEDSHVVRKEGMTKEFETREMRVLIESCGRNHNVTVIVSNDDFDRGSSGLLHSATFRSGGKVTLRNADMTKQQCGAMVNPANRNLKHGAGLAKILSDAGGPAVNEDCQRLIARRKEIRTGEIYVGVSGHLPCKHLIHAVGPDWRDNHGDEAEKLKRVTENALIAAKDLDSICMSGISCGIFGGRPETCTKIMVEAIVDWLNGQGTTSKLREVMLVDKDDAVLRGFEAALRQVSGSQTSAPQSTPLSAATGFQGESFEEEEPKHESRGILDRAAKSFRSWFGSTTSTAGASIRTEEDKLIVVKSGDILEEKVRVSSAYPILFSHQDKRKRERERERDHRMYYLTKRIHFD